MPEPPAEPTTTTWTVLLAKWTALAKAALALPETDDAERWRRCLPAIINLQAVERALEELDDVIEEDDRAVALDKAEILIRESAADIHDAWPAMSLPESLAETIEAAREAIELCRAMAWVWIVEADQIVTPHPGDLSAAVLATGFEGELMVPAPGVPLFAGCPAACVRAAGESPVPIEVLALIAAFLGEAAIGPARAPLLQAYRQFDFAKGGPVRDFVVAFDGELPAGQPLLVTAVAGREVMPVSMPPKNTPPLDPLPVVYEDDERDNDDEGRDA